MLDAATRCFARSGFGGVSMDEIADEVGVTKPMLYAYFDSKDGLYAACIERTGAPLMAALRTAIDPAASPESQLWSGLLAFFAHVEEHRDEWRAFYLDASTHGGAPAEQVAQMRRELTGTLTALLTRAATAAGVAADLAPEMEAQARALIGATEALAAWWIEHPSDATRELLALRLMNFAWMGFGDLLDGRFWLPAPG